MLCVYNNSAAARTPLALALTVDDGKTWDQLAVIEADPKGEQGLPFCWRLMNGATSWR